MKQGMILVMTMGMRSGIGMTKYKLYGFSGTTYVIPLDTYEYVDETAESYFEDYCAGVVVPPSLHVSLIAL